MTLHTVQVMKFSGGIDIIAGLLDNPSNMNVKDPKSRSGDDLLVNLSQFYISFIIITVNSQISLLFKALIAK